MNSLFSSKAEALLYVSLAPIAAAFGAVCAKLAVVTVLF